MTDSWNAIKLVAQQIMETIIASPCNEIVHTSVMTPKGPLSFDSILENVKNGTYTSSKDWDKDCRTYIATMAETYKQQPLELVILKHVRITYVKLIQKCQACTTEGWIKRANQLRVKIDDLLRTVPDCLKKYSQLMPVPPIHNTQLQRSDIETIAKFDQKITNNLELMQLLRILNDDPAALEITGDTAKVDVQKLRNPTQLKLYLFLKDKIEGDKK